MKTYIADQKYCLLNSAHGFRKGSEETKILFKKWKKFKVKVLIDKNKEI